MKEDKVLDLTSAKCVYVDRDDLAKVIHAKIKNDVIPEIDSLTEEVTKCIKNRGSAVKLLIALRRDRESYSERAIFIDACLERIHSLEVKLEDLNRTLHTLPTGAVIKLTFEQAKYYGL